MAKTIRYQKMTKMLPREGVRYSTTYVKQTLEQRRELVRHIQTCVTEIADVIERSQEWADYIQVPQRGFPKTTGSNRSIQELLTDMIIEAKKRHRGLPGDFALAPIERWNKLFKGTDYEIELVQTFGSVSNNFFNIAEFDV